MLFSKEKSPSKQPGLESRLYHFLAKLFSLSGIQF